MPAEGEEGKLDDQFEIIEFILKWGMRETNIIRQFCNDDIVCQHKCHIMA
jgi:hypothetical protein